MALEPLKWQMVDGGSLFMPDKEFAMCYMDCLKKSGSGHKVKTERERGEKRREDPRGILMYALIPMKTAKMIKMQNAEGMAVQTYQLHTNAVMWELKVIAEQLHFLKFQRDL